MSDETPKKRRERTPSPYLACVNSELVRFTAKLLPHDSPEFQARAKMPRPPRPSSPPEEPKPDQNPPAAT
jgi:hypothetical protein